MRKILIANRGEIAVRVITTARRMGLASVAVYSEADKGALHVEMADEAVPIGPAPPRESYLVADKILAAAKKTGADAVHPGYGFLSENAAFAEACAKAGIRFIGPPAAAIRAMGLKDRAKALMTEAGVPVVPGYLGDEQDEAILRQAAEGIGYPVLIKAVAGGGGKGMRRVDRGADFAAALAAAQREGKAAFGDDRVLIEKYLARPRHIEIQVFADAHGNVLSLFERDCSLQRRHQKVIEEAPAPGMEASLRAAMGEAAVKAARAIGYEGAGTVEFILDVANGLAQAPFYFMEMNTRLQVEHPVTEMVTGIDLVEWQIRVARGEALPCRQEDLALDGHAVEARLYAEDPDNGFLPAVGRLRRLDLARGAGVRVDAGVRAGDDITIHYDPMIAKIIAHGPDRQAALERLGAALDASAVLGLATNKAFLARALRHPAFLAGDIDTGFIPRHLDALLPGKASVPQSHYLLGALARLLDRRERARAAAKDSGDPHSPWHAVDGWRLNLPARETLRFTVAGAAVAILAEHEGEDFHLSLGDTRVTARGRLQDGRLEAYLDGRKHLAHAVFDGEAILLTAQGVTLKLEKAITHVEDEGDVEARDTIAAPMPGKVLSLAAQPGDRVKKGDKLIVLEAMKMEHSLAAPRGGVIEAVFFAPGDQVKEGETLIAFKTE
ncbi:MAG: acetyl-CoA carboxylase biotin carboxylase subunit [Pseudomonadota bacterium]